MNVYLNFKIFHTSRFISRLIDFNFDCLFFLCYFTRIIFSIYEFTSFHVRTRKPINNEDDDIEDNMEDVDMDAVTDSEEEYTETERKLLEKIRKQRTTENFDSDDEVYRLQDDSEEEKDDQQDSMESDIEGTQKDYDMPSDRAWGNKAKVFYSSDYKYTDYASAPQKDLVNADMEEEEGKRLHLRSMGQHLAFDGSSFSRNKSIQIIKDSKVQENSKQISDKESFMIMINTFKGIL